jgi:hypothetical protein
VTAYQFILSDRITPRLSRHLAFWLFYLFYTLLISLPGIGSKILTDPEFYKSVLTEAYYYLPLYLLSVYFTLYFIYPGFLNTRNVFYMLASILVLVLITFFGSNFITRHFFLAGQVADDQDILTITLIKGIGEQIIITGSAISIKALKEYYIRDEGYKKLMVQRIYHQLDMMKIKMEPAILLGVLKNIHADIRSSGQFAPEMILKLSDLLSYILYESDARHVPVKKEINMVSDYSSLKELSFGNRFEPKFHITGNFDHQTITPLVLLPFLELTFPKENENNPEFILSEINIHVSESDFHFKVETNLDFPGSNHQILNPVFDNARQNLIINYPEKHNIRVEESENGYSITLKLNLNHHPAMHNQTNHPST